ncbi:MAG: hypothetical protein AAF329_00465 [Cyanobacteria bacterium P01_A01_bin.17]
MPNRADDYYPSEEKTEGIAFRIAPGAQPTHIGWKGLQARSLGDAVTLPQQGGGSGKPAAGNWRYIEGSALSNSIMTNGPDDQPMSNTELQQAIANLTQAVVTTNQSVQTLRGDIAAGFDRTRAELQTSAEDVTGMIGSLAQEVDRTQATIRETSEKVSETSGQVQVLIDDAKADRAESQRQQLSVGSMLAQILERVDQIWRRLNA